MGHTQNTLTLMIVMSLKKKISQGPKKVYEFVWGCIQSHPGPHVARGWTSFLYLYRGRSDLRSWVRTKLLKNESHFFSVGFGGGLSRPCRERPSLPHVWMTAQAH